MFKSSETVYMFYLQNKNNISIKYKLTFIKIKNKFLAAPISKII